MKEVKAPKKPLIYYYCFVLLIVFLFNFLVTPILSNQRVVSAYLVFLGINCIVIAASSIGKYS